MLVVLVVVCIKDERKKETANTRRPVHYFEPQNLNFLYFEVVLNYYCSKVAENATEKNATKYFVNKVALLSSGYECLFCLSLPSVKCLNL